jgi:tungstate transport system substrate-binding protein
MRAGGSPSHREKKSMRLGIRWLCGALTMIAVGCVPARAPLTPAASTTAPQTVRCAIIGGLADTGLWQELTDRFTQQSGHAVEIVVRGPKHDIGGAFVEDRCHLIAMHSSDTIINLVADGHAIDPQPWARNDFVLVGPADDPAGIRGMKDAGEALRKIYESNNRLLVHASHGAMEVLGDVMSAAGLSYLPEQTVIRLDDRHRQMLLIADQERAYTVIGRIPFVNGKVPKGNLEVMVQGDPRLRRPYLVAIAPPEKHRAAEHAAARDLVTFLRSEPAQEFLAEYGRGVFDTEPLFFRIHGARAESRR